MLRLNIIDKDTPLIFSPFLIINPAEKSTKDEAININTTQPSPQV